MQPTYDLLVAGEINPDLILASPNLEPRFGQQETLVEKAALTIGSSAVIFACGAARLGLKTTFIGLLGTDLFGNFMLQSMAGRGIDTSNVIVNADQHTGFSVILARNTDRAILTYMGAMDALRAEDLSDKLLHQARHLHITSYFLQTALQPGLPALLQRARTLGLTTSLDTNWDPAETWKGVSRLLEWIDVFLPNQNEALAISGETNLDDALLKLSQACPVVAVKLGERGAIAWRRDELVRLPALPVQVADTVGAGDSFDAGFLYGFLHDWDIKHSLALGVACGSLSTQQLGGTDSQPTLEETQPAMRKMLNTASLLE
jgi:sugar/nucleoside kinase (ribokinase family)